LTDTSTITDLLRYDTPGLANALEKLDLRPRSAGFTDASIRQVVAAGEHGRLAGVAVTARLSARDPGDDGIPIAQLYAAIGEAAGPPVVVIQDDDNPVGVGSLLGEVIGTLLAAIGVVGFVTNGGVRDLAELREFGLNVFAQGPCVSHAYVRLTAVGVQVTIGGLPIANGDLLHGDEHGLLQIPWEAAPQLPALADEIREGEQATIRWAHSEEFSLPALLARRRAAH
jgi:4-hydroxy-4-methyl-2-oxoglutarate aldolase